MKTSLMVFEDLESFLFHSLDKGDRSGTIYLYKGAYWDVTALEKTLVLQKCDKTVNARIIEFEPDTLTYAPVKRIGKNSAKFYFVIVKLAEFAMADKELNRKA